MGTNYYIQEKKCSVCNHRPRPYHIGKSSFGWCFSLHVDPGKGINTLEDIQNLWEGKVIENEYGEKITPEKMIDIICNRAWKGKTDRGFAFYVQNSAKPGPNGLIRFVVDGKHCVGNGPGTYDYIIGEFS